MSKRWDEVREEVAIMHLEPRFPVGQFTPKTKCSDIHPRGPIPKGSRCVCMAGHESGVDGSPGMIEAANYDYPSLAALNAQAEAAKAKPKGKPKFRPRIKAKKSKSPRASAG